MSRRSSKQGLGCFGLLQVAAVMAVCCVGCLLIGAYNSKMIVYCLDGHMEACVNHILPDQTPTSP